MTISQVVEVSSRRLAHSPSSLHAPRPTRVRVADSKEINGRVDTARQASFDKNLFLDGVFS
ncbi:hypothetical protein Pan216_12530 [Planctomycetes bacterium Pan216]|uniref:Uncharacterized protein n=1 Tax=Kolteria novifilia TaxID=2527975 RepID=A0A518B0D2_9BACT|nr:hypothetical protein Pan216_12530 [Planctomycetes bacterium Pan216]